MSLKNSKSKPAFTVWNSYLVDRGNFDLSKPQKFCEEIPIQTPNGKATNISMCRACASAEGRRNQQGNGRRRLAGRRSHVSTSNGIGHQVSLQISICISHSFDTPLLLYKHGVAYPTFWHSTVSFGQNRPLNNPTIFLHKPIWNFGWETNFLEFKSW